LAYFVPPGAISVIKRQLYDVPFQTLAEATIDANREMEIARCAAAIFAKASRVFFGKAASPKLETLLCKCPAGVRFEVFFECQRFVFIRKRAIPNQHPRLEFCGVR
jgi:hypothetical protein